MLTRCKNFANVGLLTLAHSLGGSTLLNLIAEGRPTETTQQQQQQQITTTAVLSTPIGYDLPLSDRSRPT